MKDFGGRWKCLSRGRTGTVEDYYTVHSRTCVGGVVESPQKTLWLLFDGVTHEEVVDV